MTSTPRKTDRQIEREEISLLRWDTEEDYLLFWDTEEDYIVVTFWNDTVRTKRTIITPSTRSKRTPI